MATAAELTKLLGDQTSKIAVLEERIANHITFFRWASTAALAWLSFMSLTLYNMNGTMGKLGKDQASIPARTAQALLKVPIKSKEAAASTFGAVSAVLRSASGKNGKPDLSVVKNIAPYLVEAQKKYPDVPQVWQATSAFINYKSDISLSSNAPAFKSAGKDCSLSIAPSAGGVIFKNCEDSLEDAERRAGNTRWTDGRLMDIVFINCIVHYEGGLLQPRSIVFLKSLLRFDVSHPSSESTAMALEKITSVDPQDESIKVGF